jgi:hypothetical protein
LSSYYAPSMGVAPHCLHIVTPHHSITCNGAYTPYHPSPCSAFLLPWAGVLSLEVSDQQLMRPEPMHTHLFAIARTTIVNVINPPPHTHTHTTTDTHRSPCCRPNLPILQQVWPAWRWSKCPASVTAGPAAALWVVLSCQALTLSSHISPADLHSPVGSKTAVLYIMLL